MSSLRLMLWLKWMLTWRGMMRSRSQKLGAVFFAVVFIPISVTAAIAIWWLDSNYPGFIYPVTRDALGALFLLWLVTPLLGFQLNDSFDLTRLFVYPISLSRLFIGSLLGGLLDGPALLMLPLLVVIAIKTYSGAEAAIAAAVLLVLFLVLALSLSQMLMLLLIGFLRSRRFRDLTIVLFPLLGLSYYLGQRLLTRRLQEGGITLTALLQSPTWRVMDYLPPGWAARGLIGALRGNFGETIVGVALLCLTGTAAIAISVTALKRLYMGDVGPANARVAPTRALKQSHDYYKPDKRTRIPSDIRAIFSKEWFYLVRDPQYKALAVQSAYTLVWLGVSFSLPSMHSGGLPQLELPLLLYILSSILMLSLCPLIFNIWAGEGAAITVLFSFPTRRKSLILGKNAAHGVLMVGINAVGLTLAAALTRTWVYLPLAALWVVLALPLLLAMGNLVSIRLPHRMLVRGQRWGRGGKAFADSGGGAGCAVSLLYILVYCIAFIVLAPALAAVLLPGRFGISSNWHFVSVPLAAAYSAGIYAVLLPQAESWLRESETDIISKVVPV